MTGYAAVLDPRKTENLKKRYESQYVTTASPEMSVVMLYERLVADLESANALFGDFEAAYADLAHASKPVDFKPIFDLLDHGQRILRLLRGSLRADLWPAANDLAALYDWFLTQLSDAATHQQRSSLQACLPLLRQLTAAWKTAAEKVICDKESANGTQGYAFAEARSQIADYRA